MQERKQKKEYSWKGKRQSKKNEGKWKKEK